MPCESAASEPTDDEDDAREGGKAGADGNGPERTVTGTVITSAHDPAVRIELPPSVQYVGADRWVLYGMADCELHAFVDADARKAVRKLYWVQFEQYLPTRPELHHTYDSPQHTSIGGLYFYVDTWVQVKGAKEEHGSDSEHIEALLRGKGYDTPAGMIAGAWCICWMRRSARN